jgi:hypothetical protein
LIARNFSRRLDVAAARYVTSMFCYRILWKSKKDNVNNTEDNIDVLSHLAFAVVATIVTVKEKVATVAIVTEFFIIYAARIIKILKFCI